MQLHTLDLSDFRNFSHQHFKFGEKFNLFIGANAQGKTNVLEAIALLATGRSFRTAEISDLVRWGSPTGTIGAGVHQRDGEDVWRALLSHEGKKLQKNGKGLSMRTRRGLACVLFSPEEISLLRHSPAARRRYIDMVIARLVPQHGPLVREYERILAQRNRLLADLRLSHAEIGQQIVDWDHQLVATGVRMVEARALWLRTLNEDLAVQYRTISGSAEKAALNYTPFCGTEALTDTKRMSQVFERLLGERRSDELVRRMTLVGPQRDDFIACIGTAEAKRFGSQGEHRSFVLALKIAEMELHRRIDGEVPLLLLDDVTSELDEQRCRCFFDYVGSVQGQVFITATDGKAVVFKEPRDAVVFSVVEGSATQVFTS